LPGLKVPKIKLGRWLQVLKCSRKYASDRPSTSLVSAVYFVVCVIFFTSNLIFSNNTSLRLFWFKYGRKNKPSRRIFHTTRVDTTIFAFLCGKNAITFPDICNRTKGQTLTLAHSNVCESKYLHQLHEFLAFQPLFPSPVLLCMSSLEVMGQCSERTFRRNHCFSDMHERKLIKIVNKTNWKTHLLQ